MSDLLQALYQQDILDHAKNPRNYGQKLPSDLHIANLNPSCGDNVTLYGFIKDDKLSSLYFQGAGCTLSMAMASKLTEYTVNMPLEEILKLDHKLIQKLLGIELGINRMQCGLLSIQALQKGVQAYLDTKGEKV